MSAVDYNKVNLMILKKINNFRAEIVILPHQITEFWNWYILKKKYIGVFIFRLWKYPQNVKFVKLIESGSDFTPHAFFNTLKS